MLYRPNSDGLELLEEVIRENSNKMSSELLSELIQAYNVVNDEVGQFDETEEYIIHDITHEAETHIGKIESKVGNMQEKIDRLYDNVEDRELEKFFLGVSDILSDFEIDDFVSELETCAHTSKKDEMRKMIDMGYRFNCGEGWKLTKERDAAIQEQAENERLKLIEREWEEKKSDLLGGVAEIEKVEDNVYRVWNHGIDAVYDMDSGKVKGKGSRNFKHEIIETINLYIEFQKSVSV